MKTLQYLIIICISIISISTFTSGNLSREWDPMSILTEVAGKTNDENYGIQTTALNDFNQNRSQYDTRFKITRMFDEFRMQITPYLQWAFYIWLSWAVIWLIYNGFLMVTKPAGSWADMSNIKARIQNITIGVILLTGFYVIIKVILSIITYVLQ